MSPRRGVRSALVVVAVGIGAAGCGGEVRDQAATVPREAGGAATAVATSLGEIPPAPAAPTSPSTPAPTTPAPADPAADQTAVRATVEAYLAAFVQADGVRGCELLTQRSREAFLARVRDTVSADACPAAFTQVAQATPELTLGALRSAQIGAISVTGTTAAADVAVAGTTLRFELEHQQGGWRVANLPGT